MSDNHNNNIVISTSHRKNRPMDVRELRYEFCCLKCPTVVTGTLPEIERHGWVDVSSLTHRNQWLCPSCSRGLKRAATETQTDGQT